MSLERKSRSDKQIIYQALYDLLDALGALSNPNEINEALLGEGNTETINNLLCARDILVITDWQDLPLEID